MIFRISLVVIFIAGGGIVAWMGTRIGADQLLGLFVIAAIGLGYTLGFAELLRCQADSNALSRLLAATGTAVNELDVWLEQLPPNLREPVKRRVQGEAVALPAPVLTPYLTGFLVMLGLLGTFVGMVTTLQGAVVALEGSTELAAIRSGLATPIKGLGVAFGTSVAGVAASAALGFMATLIRHRRLQCLRLLDYKRRTCFEQYSVDFFRRRMLDTTQAQSALLPDLVERLGSLTDKLGDFAQNIDRKLTSGQEAFHQRIESAHLTLAHSIGQSFEGALSRGGELAGESIKPAVAEAMSSLTVMASKTLSALEESDARQRKGAQEYLLATTEVVNSAWRENLAERRDADKALLDAIATGQAQQESSLAHRSEVLVDAVAALQSRVADNLSVEKELLKGQLEVVNTMAQLEAQLRSSGDQSRDALRELTEHTGQQVAGLLGGLRQQGSALLAQISEVGERAGETMEIRHNALAGRVEQTLAESMASSGRLLSETLEPLVGEVTRIVTESVDLSRRQLDAAHEEHLRRISGDLQKTTDTLAASLAESSAAHTASVAQLVDSVGATATGINDKLAASVAQIVESVVGLREDTAAVLEKDQGLMAQQRTLVDSLITDTGTLQQAFKRQQDVVAGLTSDCADMLSQVGSRFESSVERESDRLASVAEQFAVSAVEISSLGEALESVVTQFTEANNTLIAAVEQIDASLCEAAQRSDQQMGYYIAQAKDVIDHSLVAQQELIDRLRNRETLG